MRLSRSSLAVAMALVMPACTVFTSLDGFTSDEPVDGGGSTDASNDGTGPSPPPRPDAVAPTDAGDAARADAPDDSTTTPPNLFTDFANGTFETGCPVAGYNSTITTDPVAHGGTVSCRVCAKSGGSGSYTLDQDVSTSPVVGARYHGEAWVRSAPNATIPPAGIGVTLRGFNNPPFVQIEEKQSPGVGANETWQLVAVDFDVTKQASMMDVYVGAAFQNNTCFLVDDITVRRVK